MRAIVQERFGPPDSLRLADVAVPEIGAGDVLVEVRAAAVNPYDWHMLRGDPHVARLFGVGFTRPKARIAGIDTAGRVTAVGADVQTPRPGDSVFGLCPGAFADCVRTQLAKLAPMPAGLSFEQAAAIPMAGATALRAIRDVAAVQPGQRVLITGAGGGIGTFATQIATALGAEVTGVCSAGKAELVRSLGAGHVIDYLRENFTDTSEPYDVVLDNVGTHSLRQLRRAVTPTGTLLINGGGSPGRVFGAMGGRSSAARRSMSSPASTSSRFRPTRTETTCSRSRTSSRTGRSRRLSGARTRWPTR